MKIAFFSDTFFPQINGVVQVVHNLAESLSSRGHEVCVFTISEDAAEITEQKPSMHYRVITIPSIPIPMYPGQRLTAPIGLAFSKLKAFKPDIIHTHTPLAMGQEAYLCARRFDVPLVGTHHTFFDQYLKIWHLDYRWARYLSWKVTNQYYNRCAIVITPTKALSSAMQKYGLDVPIEVIPNPMPLSDSGFKPDEAPREKKEKSIVYMGRLSREKDVDKVLEAYAHIRALKGKDVRLVIIGDGPRREELEGRAAELGIAEGVTFTGFLRGKELADELRRHDVFVTASKSENMPVSVLEAMASGLPVVAVAALGMREIVREGVNGFLAPPDDTQSIAEHLLKIISNPILRKKFALASSELALLHDPALIATRHEELYMNLAKARNKKITDFARDASI